MLNQKKKTYFRNMNQKNLHHSHVNDFRNRLRHLCLNFLKFLIFLVNLEHLVNFEIFVDFASQKLAVCLQSFFIFYSSYSSNLD